MEKQLILCLLTLLIRARASVLDDSLIVKTSHGKILGATVNTDIGTKVDVWSSVPFGKPPVGELRFKHPLPPDSWDGVVDVTGVPNTCYQKSQSPIPSVIPDWKKWIGNSTISEDCLYLTVVVPNPRPQNAAVLFWLVGGANTFGSITQQNLEYNIPASLGDVIIVTPQYRLSAFGFLYGDTDDVPGNAGLYDQLLALQWVQDNIKAFGGDPRRVTISGTINGGASVGMFLTSPLSSNLYSQAILQSGAPNLFFGTQHKDYAKGLFYRYAKQVKCHQEGMDLSDIVKCLQTKPASALIKPTYMGMFQPVPDDQIVFGVGSSIIPKIPTDPPKKILSGSCTSEASIGLTISLPDIVKLREDNNIDEKTFTVAVKRLLPFLPLEAQKLMIYNYKNWDNPDDSRGNLEALIKLFSDVISNCAVQEYVDFAYKAKWDVYKYFFDYKFKALIDIHKMPSWVGDFMGIDLIFSQGFVLRKDQKESTDQDKDISKAMMTYFLNFVKTGDPNKNENGDSPDVFWGQYKYEKNKISYLNFSSSGIHFTEDGRHNKDCIIWDEFVPLFWKRKAPEQECPQELSEDIDVNIIEDDNVVTITKLYQSSFVNPKMAKKFNLHQTILNSMGNSLAEAASSSGMPKLVLSKTNTTTRFFSKKNSFTTKQDSRTLSIVKN